MWYPWISVSEKKTYQNQLEVNVIMNDKWADVWQLHNQKTRDIFNFSVHNFLFCLDLVLIAKYYCLKKSLVPYQSQRCSHTIWIRSIGEVCTTERKSAVYFVAFHSLAMEVLKNHVLNANKGTVQEEEMLWKAFKAYIYGIYAWCMNGDYTFKCNNLHGIWRENHRL